MSALKFISHSLQNFKTVGTITRSSANLCKKMISHVDFSTAKVIVELGAGDGVITKHILKAMRPDATLLVFELLPQLAEIIKEIDDDRMVVIVDNADKIGEYLKANGFDKADAIVSAIPFVNIPKPISYGIVEAARDSLIKGGPFIQMHYSKLVSDMYKEVFGNLRYHFVAINFPPVFIHICEKE